MKLSSRIRAFTLIEMLTVMAVIAVLAGLVLSVNGLAQSKAARARALGDITALSTACESYKADNGTYPREETSTDLLDPRVDGNPTSGGAALKYQTASLYLYKALNGDALPAEAPDFKPETKSYAPDFFKPSVLSMDKTGEPKVRYIQDPFGNSYGYSTIGAKAEEEFQAKLRKSPTEPRPKDPAGFNPTFDLWSTGGATRGATSADQAKWVKNW